MLPEIKLVGRKQAPKARPHTSLGQRPRSACGHISKKPTARSIESIPQVSLLTLHTVPLHNPAKLRTEIYRAEIYRTEIYRTEIYRMIMRFLPIAVRHQCVEIRTGFGKGTVFALLCERRTILLLHPLRRRRLQLFNQRGNRNRPRKTDCQMHMVCDTAHTVAFASSVARDSCQIGMEIRTNRVRQHWQTVFCTEDHVVENKGQRLWHRAKYRSGRWPSDPTNGSLPKALP